MWRSPKGLASRHGWVGIETYGKAKQEWLSTFLELPNGIPSHDTFGRIFSQLDPQILESNFQSWVKVIAGKLGLEIVAIDGKSINGSYDRESSLKSLVMVSAWSSSHKLVLGHPFPGVELQGLRMTAFRGQVEVEQKSNEIKAIPILLEQLDLKGGIVTTDAMGTQTSIAKQIQYAGAEYILALKANHPTLAKDGRSWFEQHQNGLDKTELYTTESICEAGHHRIEKRCFVSVRAEQVFEPSRIEQWAGLQTLVVEQSSRLQLWNKTTQSLRFFLSSLPPDFPNFPSAIRSHWGVENQLHWCLDVIFAEDDSRIRQDHAPRNMSLLRRLALNLLRQDTSKGSLKMKRYQAGLNNNFLLQILSNSNLF